ncbi:uncharacterized protein LOC143884543 [Tasmannia lanceolata]|uniref:uncharacterized protein LOC143884543 n=1 Tax=Tasmannia lanceolata TaxID=3420 RepID=UPI0040644BDE
MASDLNLLDDILLQPTNNTVRVAGKFKPKAKSRPKNEQSITTHSVPSDAAQFKFSSCNSSSTMPCTTAPTDPSHLDLQKDLGGKSGTDVDMVSSCFESLNDFLFQDSAITESVSAPLDPHTLSSQNEELDTQSTHSAFPPIASFESSNIGTSNFSPMDLSVQFVTQESVDPIDAQHSEPVIFDNNGNSQTDEGRSRMEATDMFSSLESLNDFLSQPTTASDNISHPLDSLCHEDGSTLPVFPSISSSTIRSCSSAQVEPCSELFVPQELVDHSEASHSESPVLENDENLQRDVGISGAEAVALSSSFESFDDIFFQHTTTVSQAVGKFRPKPIARPRNKKTVSIPSALPESVESVSPPVDPQLPSSEVEVLAGSSAHSSFPLFSSVECLTTSPYNSAPMDPSSQLIVTQGTPGLTYTPHSEADIFNTNVDLCRNNGSSGREAAIELPSLGSLDEIVLQPTTTVEEFIEDSTPSFPPDAFVDSSTMHPCDITPTVPPFRPLVIQEPAYHDEASNLEPVDPGSNGELPTVPETSGRERTNIRKGKTSTGSKETGKAQPQTVKEISQGVEEIEARRSSRQLRKRAAIHAPADEIENGADEASNNSMMDGDYGINEDYRGEDPPEQKRAPRKPKRPAAENEKPVRRRKKVSEEPDPVIKQSPPKKFRHSCRRNRRQVDKVLLETPEEEIDPRKLMMKDLIILAEIKERKTNKEAAALKKSFPNQSANNSFANNTLFDDDDPLASTHGVNPDGDQENPRVEPSCTKLNYHSFMVRTPKERWSKSDTELLYKAIRQFGTDFAMIQQLFPGRTRHQVKLKYKAEERKHPLEVADALIHRSKDHSHFEMVIERLKAQAEQNSNRDTGSPDATGEDERNSNEGHTELSNANGENEEEVAEGKEEEMAKNLEPEVRSHDGSQENQYIYEWSNNASPSAASPQDIGKDYCSLF